MGTTMDNTSYFSDICIKDCKGMCCDPWWGIISYTMVKEGGLSSLSSFRAEVLKCIKAREQRIIEGYTTNENPKRPLFKSPEKYNVSIKDIKINGTSFTINILAMFAFRCLFISEDKVCLIHPSILGGDDIRPPHCGYMGSLNVRPGEKGYCRIIHAAEGRSASTVSDAILAEKTSSEKHLREGVRTADEAADRVIEQLKDYCSKYAAHLFPQKAQSTLGRNDPCWCGSGKKFKKCHG